MTVGAQRASPLSLSGYRSKSVGCGRGGHGVLGLGAGSSGSPREGQIEG